MDLENSVPMFSKLFMAQPTHHGRDREWLLRVILAGMRSPNDLTVLQAKQVYYSSMYSFMLFDY